MTLKLSEFIREAWKILEPDRELLWNWHIDAIAEHLEALTEGVISKLVINVPPGHMKSLSVAVFWPAWVWTTKPWWRSLFGSYAQELALRDSVKCRDVIESNWYRQTFKVRWGLRYDQNTKAHFENTRRGFRFSLSVGGRATGFRGDSVCVDDPLNVRDRFSPAKLEECITWWDHSISTRLNDSEHGRKIIIMQRLAERDLSGYVIARNIGYEHLCLPTEFDPASRASTSIGWSDPRTHANELLNPPGFGPGAVAAAKREMGSQGFAEQHNQSPTPREGGLAKRHWWQFYDGWYRDDGQLYVRTNGTVRRLEKVIQSWDLPFKDEEQSSYVAGGVWGKAGPDYFKLDLFHDKLEFTEQLKAFRYMTQKWPEAREKLVEDKANGSALISVMRKTVSGIIAVNPDGDKMLRAAAVTPDIEAGNVWLPRKDAEDWVDEFIEEWAKAKPGGLWDRVDETSQAIRRLQRGIGIT